MRLPLFGCIALLGAVLSACAVSPNGPAAPGAAHGTLGSDDMSDYYYRKDAGWVYVFSNTQHIYNNDGTTTTLSGANDTVFTLGADGLAPNGDTMYRYEVSYRVLSSCAGRGPLTINYVSSINGNSAHGAFVEPGYTVDGMTGMTRLGRPVSCDTILAGIAGEIRTHADDFSNAGSHTWQRDTLWCTQHLDSVFIWEHQNGSVGPIVQERCIFVKNFNGGASWSYDVINDPDPTTTCKVNDPDFSFTGPTATFSHTASIRVRTGIIDDKKFNQEVKYFACGTGLVYQYDWWYMTTDGMTATKQDMVRSLVSLSQN